MSDARKIDFMPITISAIAEEVSRRVPAGSTLPVYSVTKHRGFVLSREYFKKQVFSRDLEGYKEVRHGEIAYATIHLDEGSIGAFTNTEACLISPIYTSFKVDRTRVNPEFLARLLKTPQYVARFATLGKGTVHRRKAIPFERLSNLKVVLPPLPEQDRIVAILDAAEALQEKRRQSIAKLDSLLESVFLDMFGDPRRNLHDWPQKPLSDVCSIDAPLVDPTSIDFAALPLYGPDRITKDSGELLPAPTAREQDATSPKFYFENGSILYSKIRPNLNKVAIAPRSGLCSADVYPVAVSDSGTNEFLWRLLLTRDFLDYAMTCSNRANIPKLNRQQFLSYSAIWPPHDLQRKFSIVVQRIHEKRKLYCDYADKVDLLFISLQQRAFRGEL